MCASAGVVVATASPSGASCSPRPPNTCTTSPTPNIIRPDEYGCLLTYRVELLAHHAVTVDPDLPPRPNTRKPPLALLDTTNPHDEPDHDLGGWTSPTCPPLCGPPAAARVDDIDIPALRARRDAAHQHARRLAAAAADVTLGAFDPARAADRQAKIPCRGSALRRPLSSPRLSTQIHTAP